jgi:hypothetical protein
VVFVVAVVFVKAARAVALALALALVTLVLRRMKWIQHQNWWKMQSLKTWKKMQMNQHRSFLM